MDLVEYDICRTQARIYRYIASQGYDLPIFSDACLTSDFCRRAFDTIYSRFQVADELECLDFIFPEINEKLVSLLRFLSFYYIIRRTYFCILKTRRTLSEIA